MTYYEVIVYKILIESETLIFLVVKWGFACKMQIEIGVRTLEDFLDGKRSVVVGTPG